MHYAISATWGPTDPTRAALPFIFAAEALAAGDTVLIMLFHDAVTIAVPGAFEQLVPFGPGPKFEEVFAHPRAEVLVCKPCAAARGITEAMLRPNCRMGGMGDFYTHVSKADSKAVNF